MTPFLDPKRSSLVLVDYQSRLMPALEGGPAALGRAKCLAMGARILGVRTATTAQNPAGLGPGDADLDGLADARLEKRHFDGCADGLAALLTSPGRDVPSDIVIAGCETHVCLAQSARGLLRAGFRVHVATDACASRRSGDRETALARLRDEGCRMATVEMALFEWLGSCDHPGFRDVLALVKQG